MCSPLFFKVPDYCHEIKNLINMDDDKINVIGIKTFMNQNLLAMTYKFTLVEENDKSYCDSVGLSYCTTTICQIILSKLCFNYFTGIISNGVK